MTRAIDSAGRHGDPEAIAYLRGMHDALEGFTRDNPSEASREFQGILLALLPNLCITDQPHTHGLGEPTLCDGIEEGEPID